jgi:hypothetical protein
MKTLHSICSVLLAASTVLAVTGCATHDRRDAPWDPRPESGRSLIDVIPNWDHQPCRPQSDRDCPRKARLRHQ